MLKLSNQQLRTAIGLELGSKICERLKCVFEKDVTEDAWHGTRPDAKRPDGLTLFPWAVGKQLFLDVTVVDSLASCRIKAGSVCNPGTAAAEAEEQKK